MKRPYWLSIVGGPNALSIWTWVVSFVWTVSTTGIFEPMLQGRFSLAWVTVTVISQSLIGLGVWITIKAVLPRQGQRPRPLLVISAFVALGVLRAVTMQVGAEVTDYDDGLTLTDRMVFGVGFSAVFGILIALVVDGARTHARTMGQLRSAQSALEEELRHDEQKLEHLHEEFVHETQQELLGALETSDLTPDQIRAWARDVVRPLSHELAALAAEPDVNQGEREPTPTPVPVRERLIDIAVTMRPPATVALVAIAESLAFLIAFQYESPAIALTHAVIGAVLITALMWLFTCIYRPIRSAFMNAFIITLGIAIVASVAVLGDDLIVRTIFPAANTYPLYVGSILLIGLGLSIYQAVRAVQSTAEADLAITVGDLVDQSQHTARAITGAQSRASRFLHDSIQGILYAGALSGASAAHVRREIVRAFEDFSQPVPEPTNGELRASFDQLIAMWQHALDVQVSIDDETMDAVFTDPQTTERLLSVISEGLTNAAKHSTGSTVLIHLQLAQAGTTITITTYGAMPPTAERGLGLGNLAAAARHWSLRSDGNTTVLTATVP